MKQCKKCMETKKYSDFHKNKRSPDGYKTWCILCVREYDQNRLDSIRKYPRKIKGKKIHCRRCNQYLERNEFWGNDLTYCKKCKKQVGINSNLKRYGLSIDTFYDLEKSQNGLCKICGEPEKKKKRLSVDHDHSCCPESTSCGKCIRGLLCFRCNAVLGQMQDNIILLKKMIEYLEQ